VRVCVCVWCFLEVGFEKAMLLYLLPALQSLTYADFSFTRALSPYCPFISFILRPHSRCHFFSRVLRCDVLTITAPRTEAELAADDNKEDLTTKKKPCIVISARVHPVCHSSCQSAMILSV